MNFLLEPVGDFNSLFPSNVQDISAF